MASMLPAGVFGNVTIVGITGCTSSAVYKYIGVVRVTASSQPEPYQLPQLRQNRWCKLYIMTAPSMSPDQSKQNRWQPCQQAQQA